jgi:hypothetical protein
MMLNHRISKNGPCRPFKPPRPFGDSLLAGVGVGCNDSRELGISADELNE